MNAKGCADILSRSTERTKGERKYKRKLRKQSNKNKNSVGKSCGGDMEMIMSIERLTSTVFAMI